MHSDLGGDLPPQMPVRRCRSTSSVSQPSEELLDLLHTALPSCPAAVVQRMRNEGFRTVADLAGLDRQDLCELGLSMLERSRLRRAILEADAAGHVADPGGGEQEAAGGPGQPRPPVLGTSEATPSRTSRRSATSRYVDFRKRLDDVEGQKDFWCSLVEVPAATQLRKEVEQMADKLLFHRDNADLADLREHLLEKLFDLSKERLMEVYNLVDRDSDGRIQKEELRKALQMCELGLDPKALDKLLQAASADADKTLQLDEFQSVLTRLKLAQLLGTSGQKKEGPGDMVATASMSSGTSLTVFDYNAQRTRAMLVVGAAGPLTTTSAATVVCSETTDFFFFGHRMPEFPVRWVHLSFLDPHRLSARDLTLLLALTIKYHMHPLSVEDVLTQCATQVERYGNHYFAAVEYFCLDGPDDGQRPVVVRGFHVTLFCAGPPDWDTVITIEQPDRSFATDWPRETTQANTPSGGGLGGSRSGARWTDRLQKRLTAHRSRSRERQADYLMYQVVDLCTDDLSRVLRAYLARVSWLEDKLRGADFEHQQELMEWFDTEWLGEIATIRLQLRVVSRRLRGMQRLLHRLAADQDLSRVLAGYLHDVADHVHEALEDAGQLMETCNALRDSYEHAKDKEQDRRHWEQGQRQTFQDDRMNKMLFVMTIFTAIFTPPTFFCGLYGMNFVDSEGHPTIPELTWKNGYLYFWIVTIVYVVVFSAVGCWMYRRLTGNARNEVQVGRAASSAFVLPRAPNAPYQDAYLERTHAALGQPFIAT